MVTSSCAMEIEIEIEIEIRNCVNSDEGRGAKGEGQVNSGLPRTNTLLRVRKGHGAGLAPRPSPLAPNQKANDARS